MVRPSKGTMEGTFPRGLAAPVAIPRQNLSPGAGMHWIMRWHRQLAGGDAQERAKRTRMWNWAWMSQSPLRQRQRLQRPAAVAMVAHRSLHIQ